MSSRKCFSRNRIWRCIFIGNSNWKAKVDLTFICKIYPLAQAHVSPRAKSGAPRHFFIILNSAELVVRLPSFSKFHFISSISQFLLLTKRHCLFFVRFYFYIFRSENSAWEWAERVVAIRNTGTHNLCSYTVYMNRGYQRVYYTLRYYTIL